MEIGVIELLKSLGGGLVLDDMHNRIAEVLAAVKHCHRKGKVVLTIEIDPADDSEIQRVEIRGDVSYKAPQPSRGRELFYVDDSLVLHSRDPRQRPLPNMISMPERPEHLDGKSRASGERPS